MDPEMVAFLEKQFQQVREETREQISGLRQETREQISGLREETREQISGLRDETREQISGLREETREQISGLREEMGQRFDRLEETDRHTLILVEGLRNDVRLIAEGVVGFDQRMANLQETVQREVRDIMSLVRQTYPELNRRVQRIEIRLDEWSRDPIEVIREKLRRGEL